MTTNEFRAIVEEVADRLGVRAEWLGTNEANVGPIELRHAPKSGSLMHAHRDSEQYPIPFIIWQSEERQAADKLVASEMSYRSHRGFPRHFLPVGNYQTLNI